MLKKAQTVMLVLRRWRDIEEEEREYFTTDIIEEDDDKDHAFPCDAQLFADYRAAVDRLYELKHQLYERRQMYYLICPDARPNDE